MHFDLVKITLRHRLMYLIRNSHRHDVTWARIQIMHGIIRWGE